MTAARPGRAPAAASRRRLLVGPAGLVALLLLLAGCAGGGPVGAGAVPADVPSGASGGRVRVAAASDLQHALPEVVGLAERSRPGLEVQVTYGSSGLLRQQIEQGAPFDLYLSADLSYPEALVGSGLAAADDVFGYAVGRLVVWVPEGSTLPVERGLAVLTDPRVGRVAVANPEHAPYGVAARAAMHSAGVWEDVADRLVLGENVAQAADFVRTGNADVGVVGLSLVLSDPLRDEGRWTEVPQDAFPELRQGGVVLAGAQDPAAARHVRDVLLGEQGSRVMARYGFSPAQGGGPAPAAGTGGATAVPTP